MTALPPEGISGGGGGSDGGGGVGGNDGGDEDGGGDDAGEAGGGEDDGGDGSSAGGDGCGHGRFEYTGWLLYSHPVRSQLLSQSVRLSEAHSAAVWL